LTPALAHLSVQECADPDLTICIWDRVSSGIDIPAPPWSKDHYLGRGDIRGWNTNHYATSFQQGILSIFDRKEKMALYWTSDFRSIPYWERGAPFRMIFQWWFERFGCTIVHGAALGLKEGGVLLAGKGGSGKSTTALSSLQSELLYAADDYCLISPEEKLCVTSLYTSAKIHWETLKALPHLLGQCRKTDEEKALFYLYPSWKEKCITSFPLRAILIPKVTGNEKTEIILCSAADALIALAPSTVFQLSGAGRVAFQAMAHLARSLPCYHLHLGRVFSEVPKKIIQFLRGQC
jgi:hypothetical protein